jgi:NAD(P)-dependent dehydrogenase (short-subunit alcohol dehydrogenase family)
VTVTSLAGRHALVTGGGTGIGAAIASALAKAGAAVTICGRRREPLDGVAAGNPGIGAVVADVTDEAAMTKLHEQAEADRRPIDIVVANAGMVESAPAHKTSLDLWTRTLTVNLTGAFLTVRPALAHMQTRGWGRVIFIASTAGLKGYPYVAPYVAAKHGIVGLTRALALETAAAGITVNAVCPGYSETPILMGSVRRIAEATGHSEADARAALVAANPQGRFIHPSEVADAVLWLCGDAAAPITGQAISVSGGETW